MATLAEQVQGERLARIALSMIAEPNDPTTGYVLARHGGVETLRLIESDDWVPALLARTRWSGANASQRGSRLTYPTGRPRPEAESSERSSRWTRTGPAVWMIWVSVPSTCCGRARTEFVSPDAEPSSHDRLFPCLNLLRRARHQPIRGRYR